MKIELNTNIEPSFILKLELFDLAKELDYCTSREESINILLQDDRYKLVYDDLKNKNLVLNSLRYFIRSRLAFFQMNFWWFQKETLALIDFWLSDTAGISQHIGKDAIYTLKHVLSYGYQHKSTGFPDFWLDCKGYEVKPLDAEILLLLYDLRKSKLAFINNNRLGNFKPFQ